MKATAVIKRPSEVKGVVGSPMSINANVSRLGGASVIVDPDLDPTSTNPVENKAITEAIEGVRDSIDALDEAVHDLDDDKQDVLTFDSVPTVNSQNPVTSDGVYLGLQYVMGELQDNVNALSGQIDGKADLFAVHATKIGSTDNYSLDKTYAEITAALADGKYAVLLTDTDTFPYTTKVRYMNVNVLVFGGCVFTDGYLFVRGIAVMPNNVGMNVNLVSTIVNEVNGYSGSVTITAASIGALPDSTVIPSKTSQLTNDSGFVNASGAASAAPVQSVNGQTGVVSLSIPTVPSNVSAFTNDAGYITGISSSDVTSALGFTPYNATNPSHYVDASGAAAAAPVQSVNGQTGAVSLTIPVVPSNVSAFTNDAGYITLADLPIYNGGVS